MSFATEALYYVGQTVGVANLCPLFEQQYQYDLAAATLLGPSVCWLRQPQLLRSWVQTGYIVRMWTVETDEQLYAAREFGVQQVTVNDPAWALQQVGQLV